MTVGIILYKYVHYVTISNWRIFLYVYELKCSFVGDFKMSASYQLVDSVDDFEVKVCYTYFE